MAEFEYGLALSPTSTPLLVADRLRKRIREVLDDGAGIVRVVSAGRVEGDYWVGAEAWQGRPRALSTPRFDIPVMTVAPTDPGAIGLCTERYYDIGVTIECEYALPPQVHSDDERDAVRSIAEQDADVFAQALGWPANMEFTEAGLALNLASGGLVFVGFSALIEDWKTGVLKTRHSYTGIAYVAATTTPV